MTEMCCNFLNSNKLLSSFISNEQAKKLIYNEIGKIKARHSGKLSISNDDLFDMGFSGLLKAATKFDPSRGCAFSTMASKYIHNAIIDLGKRFESKEMSLESDLNTSAAQVDEKFTLKELYPSDISTDAEIEYEGMREEIERVLVNVLGDRDAEILLDYFGFFEDQLSVKEIAEVYGLTDSRIRQIRDKAIVSMRCSKAVHKVLNKYRFAA